jgi:hypothetical protein
MFNLAPGAFYHSFHGISDPIFDDIGFAELETIAKDRDVAGPFPKLIRVFRCFFAEPFQEQTAIMFRSQDLGSLGMDPAVSDADFVRLIHSSEIR